MPNAAELATFDSLTNLASIKERENGCIYSKMLKDRYRTCVYQISITWTPAPSDSAGSFSVLTNSPCADASVKRSAEPFQGSGRTSKSLACRSNRTG